MLFRSKSKAELHGSAAAAPSAGENGTASATSDGAVSSKPESEGGGSTAGGTTSRGDVMGTGTKEAQRLAVSAIRQSVAFAQIVTVLMRSPRYRHYALGDLEWLVVPALATGQWRVVRAQSKQ